MTATKFRILCLFVFLAVYIPAVIWLPHTFLNVIFWTIAGWQIGEWVYNLSDKLARKYGVV